MKRDRAAYMRDYRAQHGSTRGPRKRLPPRFSSARFVAWDGEGITHGGAHRYTYFANSDGGEVRDSDGIATTAALDLLCSADPKAIHVCYGASYDVNMILGSLPRSALKALWENDHVSWRGYRLQYRKRKSFTATKYAEPRFVLDHRNRWVQNVAARVTLWDVIGFFQAPFVAALKEYGIKDGLAQIARMKARRSSFNESDSDEIEDYCRQELSALVALMDTLRAYLIEADLPISRWDGVGAIAATMLKRHGVSAHRADILDRGELVARRAYAGGRIEITKIGRGGPVYHYDLRSAYPSAMLDLPSLSKGVWRESVVGALPRERGRCGVARVSWDFPHGLAWHPLFFRTRSGAISYPRTGRGWYWAPEVRAALAFAERMGGRVTVERSLVLHESEQRRPFAFVGDMYERRAAWKRERRPAERVLKLGLNSLYGKLAQQLGGTAERLPPFLQLEWAGWITSTTRARLVEAALTAADPSCVVMFATDGIFSTQPLDLDIGAGLGQWEATTHEELIVAQAGVYWYRDTNSGRYTVACRGFNYASMEDPGFMLDGWRRKQTMFAVPTERFVTLGTALSGPGQWQHWRTWRTIMRDLDASGTSRKRARIARERFDPHRRFVPTRPTDNDDFDLLGLTSEPYPFLWDQDGSDHPGEVIDGVPERVFLYETEDAAV